MNLRMRKVLALVSLAVMGAAANAQTLSLTSPIDGDFVGTSTTFRLRVTGASQQVRVTVKIEKNPGGNPSTTLPVVQIEPNAEGNGEGSAVWTPGTSFPEGLYDVTITATHGGSPMTPITLQVNLDTVKPEIIDFSPSNNSFVNANPVTITAVIQELNLEEWRVTVNDEDIPNNTGNTNVLSVMWDPSLIEQDGEQTIKITAKDLAGNQQTKEIKVFLDRVSPELLVLFPRPNQGVVPNGLLGVSFDVIDSRSDSVDVGAIVVELRTMGGQFIKRVSRISYSERNDTTSRWTGIVNVTLPPGITEFKLVISAVDKAGNPAIPQEVPLIVGRGRASSGGGGIFR